MAILEKEVWVKLGSRNINHFRNLGYKVDNIVKMLVKVEHLSPKNNIKVTKICDICGKTTLNQMYCSIIKCRERGDGQDRCVKCGKSKGGSLRREYIKYEESLEFYATSENKNYLLNEFSERNDTIPSKVYKNSNELHWWHCLDCNSEYDMRVSTRTFSGCNCPYCRGMRVNKTNCLWTTHPEVAKLLRSPDRGYEVTAGSSKKEEFICRECQYTNVNYIWQVINRGFSCKRCGDGISYPEKFMMNLLEQLGLFFIKETTKNNLTWSEKFRYDFYVPSLNCIIETHGMQHYLRSFEYVGGRTLEEEQENDRLKEKLAKENGIISYIAIDCRYSELEWIKNSILNSSLSDLFDLSGINWDKCHEHAQGSLIKLISDMWNSKFKNKEKIAKEFSLNDSSVLKYLKKATSLGWCDYEPEIQLRMKIVQLTKKREFIKKWESAIEASRSININRASISNALRGKSKTAGGYKWMYKEDYEEYIKQTNIS